jgi:hypothetical protein
MAAKLTILTHKIAIQLHLLAESCTICSIHSIRRPVRKILDTPWHSNNIIFLFSFSSSSSSIFYFFPFFCTVSFTSYSCSTCSSYPTCVCALLWQKLRLNFASLERERERGRAARSVGFVAWWEINIPSLTIMLSFVVPTHYCCRNEHH